MIQVYSVDDRRVIGLAVVSRLTIRGWLSVRGWLNVWLGLCIRRFVVVSGQDVIRRWVGLVRIELIDGVG